jgi:hypothetical protein
MKALQASSLLHLPLRRTSVSPNREDHRLVITAKSAVNRTASGLAGPTVEGELQELDGGVMGSMRGIFLTPSS